MSARFLAPLLGINPPWPCPRRVLGGKEGPSKQACRATMFLELLPHRKQEPGSGLFTEKKPSSRVGHLSGLLLPVSPPTPVRFGGHDSSPGSSVTTTALSLVPVPTWSRCSVHASQIKGDRPLSTSEPKPPGLRVVRVPASRTDTSWWPEG